MIKKLIVKNYRSIKNLEIDLGPMNAFIGPNNAGKSNIMKALNLVLGETYPSVRSFGEKDFYDYDKSSSIVIEVRFDSPLQSNPKVYGFKLKYDGSECEYLAIDNNGNEVTYSSGREVRVSNAMKEEVTLMYLDLNRQASQQIRPTQWTLYGKLLRRIEKGIGDPKKEEFRKGINDLYNSHIYPTLKQMEEILKNHVKQQTGLDLHLRLSILDPIETIKNLRPYLKEAYSSKEFDAEDMGAGTQSALAIAIARAYAEIVRQPLVMAIEEPELYLHPHGCRYFYELLKELSVEGVQIIYTTHERSFVNISDFKSIYLVRKELNETRVYSGIKKQVSSEEKIKIASKFDEDINEVFFADRVILVEGFSDKVACRLALEKLRIDVDKENVSIIECGSNTAIKPIAEVLKIFNIPTYALIDQDPGNDSTRKIINELENFLGADNMFLQKPKLEGMFGLSEKPNKAKALEFFPKWFKGNEPPEVYRDIYQKIKEVGEFHA